MEHGKFRIGCVIMASGMGRRFGGNKLMADFDGRPMIDRILDATQDMFIKRVVVTRHADVAAHCRARGVEAILHELPLRSDTVRFGVQAMSGEVEGCIFCPADQPLLTSNTIRALCMAFSEKAGLIFRPACKGEPGAPVLFPRWAFDELASLPDGKGGGVVAKRYPDKVHCLEIADAHELLDVDTPEALLALLGQIQK